MTIQLKHFVEVMKIDAQIDQAAHQEMELIPCALHRFMDSLKEYSHNVLALIRGMLDTTLTD